MTAVAAIRAAIVATLRSVPGIGVVNDHERYAKAVDGLRALYVPSGEQQLRGWWVRRVKLAERDRVLPRSIEYTQWRIQGVMALDDASASELAFDDLIETARAAFRANDTLGGTVSQCALPDGSEAGLQLLDAGPVNFAGVLCHGARLSLTTQRIL